MFVNEVALLSHYLTCLLQVFALSLIKMLYQLSQASNIALSRKLKESAQ